MEKAHYLASRAAQVPGVTLANGETRISVSSCFASGPR